MSNQLYRREPYVVIPVANGFIVHNTAKDFKLGHTHLKSFSVARNLIELSLSGKMQKRAIIILLTAWLESAILLTIATDSLNSWIREGTKAQNLHAAAGQYERNVHAMPRPFIVYLLNINIVAFVMCWKDKRASIRKQWRIKESTFLIIAALGGSAGLYLGMNLLRHKTKHAKFTIGVPVIFLLQVFFIWRFLGASIFL